MPRDGDLWYLKYFVLVSLVCVCCFLGRVLDLMILASARAPISSLSLLAAQSFEVSHDFCIDSVKGVSLSLELGLDCSQTLRYHWISRCRSLSPFIRFVVLVSRIGFWARP